MQPIIAVNGSDRDWTHHRYILCFGAYGWTRLMVWANSLDDALDEAVDWLADNAPGLLCDDEVNEEFKRLKEEDGQQLLPFKTDEQLWEEVTIDTTCAGNCGHYLNSAEWGIVVEDPTREQVLELVKER